MKRREFRTVEEAFSAPEGEWSYSLGPRKVEVLDDTTNGIDSPLSIPDPRQVARKHGPKAGGELAAEYIRGKFVIRRKSSKRAKRRA